MTTGPVFKSPAGERAVMDLYDHILAQWAFPFEQRLVPTRHGDTFVIASGDPAAAPLVLLHGAGTNSAIWGGDLPAYGERHRVYAVDLLGEAGKSAPSRPPWDGPAFAEWLADVLGALGVDRASLIGISQGAWTALKFATAYPERVDKLVLLTPGGIVADKTSFIVRAAAYSVLGRWGVRRMSRLLYGDQRVPDGVEEITALLMRHFRPRIGVLPLFSDGDLHRLVMPTLLVMGSHDALRDADRIAARLRATLPDLSVVLIPGAGHALLDTIGHVLPFV
jgi:pimeloyl-ACP methyl ester carboxylesterase